MRDSGKRALAGGKVRPSHNSSYSPPAGQLRQNALLTGRARRMVALVIVPPVIRLMGESDPETVSAAFTALGWHKPAALYQRYLAEQEQGRRLAFLAEWRGEFAGYVTLLWVSDYRPFAERQIPEICDLNVLPRHRRQGIGNALLDRAESAASTRGTVVGLGVGLYSDYGAAQRIYVRRGYLPDGRGIMYRNQPVAPGAAIPIDDDAALMLTRLLR